MDDDHLRQIQDAADSAKTVEELRQAVAELCKYISRQEDAAAERAAGDDW